MFARYGARSRLRVLAALTCALTMASATWQGSAIAAPSSYEAMVDEGGKLLDDGKLAEGASRLSDAYRAMPLEVRISDLGKFIVVRASDAFDEAIADDPNDELKLAHRDLLGTFFEDLRGARSRGEPTAAADEQEKKLADRLDALRRSSAAPPEPDVEPSDDEPSDDEPQDPEQDIVEPPIHDSTPPEPSKPDGLGIGLVVGGGAALIGGMALAIQGGRFPGLVDEEKQSALDAAGLTEVPAEQADAWAEHERQQRRTGTALLASGIVVAVVGVAALGWGGARLAKRRSSTLAMAPMGLRHGTGVAFSLRF